MAGRERNSLISVVLVIVLAILAIGAAWAAPLVAGPVYLPLVPKQPTYTPTATATPTRTPTPTPTRTATPIVINPITNPGFESGQIGWVFQSNQGDPILTSPFAHSGDFSAALGNGNNNRVASISQQIVIPLNSYTLQYWKYIQTTEICGQFDVVRAFVDGVLVDSFPVCSPLSDLDWTKQILNLIDYRGRRIVFRLEFTSNNTTPSYFYVDDFSFIP